MKVIAFEGLDNSGKSTQCSLLQTSLESLGYSVFLESGDVSMIYPTIRELFRRGGVSPHTNALLFAADLFDRWHMLDTNVDVVIFDRYIYSIVAYGLANGLDREWIDCAVNPLRKADVIFLLDISADEYQRRVQGRERYISPFPLNHLEKVRARYLDLCEDFGFDFLDGSLSKEVIAARILDRVCYLLEGSGRK